VDGQPALGISAPLVAGSGINVEQYQYGVACPNTCHERELYGHRLYTCLAAGDGITVEPVACKDGVTRIRISLA
jgi:hypothetical protein